MLNESELNKNHDHGQLKIQGNNLVLPNNKKTM